MKKRVVGVFFLAHVLHFSLEAESSLFGPSKRELALTKMNEQSRSEIAILSQRVDDLNERVDGLTTIIEGLNATVREFQMAKESQQTQMINQNDISSWKVKLDKLSRECVTRNELNMLSGPPRSDGKKKSNYLATGKKEAVTSYSMPGKSNTGVLKQKSNAALYSEGVRLFQKHHYNEAEKRFSLTQSKGYKPAASNYYLGEIAYYTKQYSDAVFYYKKSAGLYDQASYIDTLLLHTAISLERTGDKSQARVFYQTIIDGYPGKKSATIAKKMIRKL
ncbi:MAG TPA: hypothetical protein ENK77_01000 [Epsilonproteobacteria bacterium]|nr:hypothetical protein [Campylobacterota bacterium]